MDYEGIQLEVLRTVRECQDRALAKATAGQLGECYPTDRRHDETIARGPDRRGA